MTIPIEYLAAFGLLTLPFLFVFFVVLYEEWSSRPITPDIAYDKATRSYQRLAKQQKRKKRTNPTIKRIYRKIRKASSSGKFCVVYCPQVGPVSDEIVRTLNEDNYVVKRNGLDLFIYWK